MSTVTATLPAPHFTGRQLHVLTYLVYLRKGGYLDALIAQVVDRFGADTMDALYVLAEDGYVTLVAPRVWLTPKGVSLGGVS